ncbi:hypothetical protein IAT38_007244 [Cryptococcus sp. DSM 104549]
MADSKGSEALEQVLDQLLDDYRDLQIHDVTTYQDPPSPLETLRMIQRAYPAVIEGFSPLTSAASAHDWRKPEVYAEVAGDKPMTVAITDDGLADSVRTLDDGSATFVKPHDTQMSIPDLLGKLNNGEASSSEAYYLQSQDGNIYRATPRPSGPPDLEMFQEYIKRDVEWMKEATGAEADAVNLWIGDKKSTTSLHHDPYENIYHVLAGSKTFTLLSPIEGLWLDQQFQPPSTLQRTSTGTLAPVLDPAPAHPIPWVSSTDFPPRVEPVVVTLKEGQTLYLPANWWHRVEQEEGDAGIVVAVNYWYTSEINPQTYAYERLAQRIARLAGRDGVLPVVGDEVPEDVWGSEGDVDSAEEWDPREWGR